MSIGKLLLACVCPVVGTSVIIKTVPSVRHAVVKNLSSVPTAKAQRPVEAYNPGTCIPLNFTQQGPIEPRTALMSLPEVSGYDDGLYQLDSLPKALPTISFASSAPSVPEPQTWAQLTAAFLVVGVALRKKMDRHNV